MKNIEIKNLIIDYNTLLDNGETIKKRIINNISLDINEGDYISILGKNGSGKSTLVKSFNGLVPITSGEIYIYGKNVKDETNIVNIRTLIGMLFQNPDNQIVASKVEEDVAFGLENLGIETNEIRKRIDDAMRLLGIYDLKDSLVSKLSGGQKQKVAIAGILAMRSKIIILDEPTSMLDKKARLEVLDIVKKLNVDFNITIIFISHYVEEIINSNRVIVINNGEILFDGEPKNFLLCDDVIKKCEIELPYITKLAKTLKQKGLNYKGNELTINEIV